MTWQLRMLTTLAEHPLVPSIHTAQIQPSLTPAAGNLCRHHTREHTRMHTSLAFVEDRNPPNMGGRGRWRITAGATECVLGKPGLHSDTLSQEHTSGDVAQVVKLLSSVCKALGPVPSNTHTHTLHHHHHHRLSPKSILQSLQQYSLF